MRPRSAQASPKKIRERARRRGLILLASGTITAGMLVALQLAITLT